MIGALSGMGGHAAFGFASFSRLRQEARGAEPPVEKTQNNSKNSDSATGLTDAERQVVEKLKQREAEVRAHERAHQMAGGAHAGSPSYSTTQGPDGKRYITGGEVSIDISPEGDPRATISKMEQVKRAAMAPSDPSSQDRAVAQQADAIKAQAQAELTRQRQEKLQEETGQGNGLTQAGGEASKGVSEAYNQASRAYRAAGSILSVYQGIGVVA